ncbi:hypothetical protein L6164_013589 [Bauhinia variegata]|uniref:Uncharacterized protein n=1 Tax=Bauhinia variegata TaxID=167791 RepID=A0ACB9NGB8_BAUVA|nr:hypothetical protein L6164_013589 [Bauhinia variegata]
MAAKAPPVISVKDEMRKWSRSIKSQRKRIALVRTMDYLRQSHLSLVREAHNHTNVVAVSIHVNPGIICKQVIVKC